MSDRPKLHNSLSEYSMLGEDALTVILYDRLLWLRNHYDVGRPELKAEVLADIDYNLRYAELVAKRRMGIS